MKPATDYDAVVVGSGPNGLAAAILMQQYGLSVLLVEAKNEVGGGMRSAELTLPGFIHDICSAIHPLAAGSPFFKTLPLQEFGLEYIYPLLAAAHPLDVGTAAIVKSAVSDTAFLLGEDKASYYKLMQPLVYEWPALVTDILGPLRWPKNPFALADFGLKGIMPVTHLAARFETEKAKALFAGMAAHAIQPLTNFTTSAVALVLLASAHSKGWPVAKGGSGNIGQALASYFKWIGGTVETNITITSLSQLPSSKAVLFDVTPRQLLRIAGHRFSKLYQNQLQRYRYGMGVFKIDWALNGQIPFTNPECRNAGTVHLGGNMQEIVAAEQATWNGHHPEKPFVLLAQQSVFDPSRAPFGKHTAWAYCHVPNRSAKNMTEAIEKQVERFAPGFRDLILGRHVMNTAGMEAYNPNYIGGDINGGVIDIGQLFTRPALRWSPYRTSARGLYICSSSTPPGGGVHGMCGYHAARRALKDIFNITVQSLD